MPNIDAGQKRFEAVAAALREEIKKGTRAPGDRMPSFEELCARFSVSSSTLERAYSRLEKEKLIVRERRRGVFVASPAENPKTHVIGITGAMSVGSMAQHPYYLHLMEGVREGAAQSGLEILLLNEDSSIHWEKVDGVLNLSWDGESILRRLPPLMRCVTMLIPIAGVPAVLADDFGGAVAATRHLLELGHRRIGFLANKVDPISQRRLAGYREALRESGVTERKKWVRRMLGSHQKYRETGRENMKAWLEANWRDLDCTALLAHNDEVAIGMIESLRAAGLRVPRDVSVVGFDGTEIGECFTPRLTTVDVPLREIGIAAFELLQKQMQSASASTTATTLLSTQLLVRDSTAPPDVRNQVMETK